MSDKEIMKHYGARPFQPFTVHLDDNRKFKIEHPEFISISRDGETIAIADTEGSFEIIDLPHVVSLSLNKRQSKRK